ncbi:MAG: sulfotransferase family 2 domain-containing protein [Bacteroidales bacterium]|nr:sulfotransferase family 2 domain-containing protein [Bacteroidales bacterium]
MIVFEHIPKTAGTTLKVIFRNSFGRADCDSNIVKKEVFTNRDLEIAGRVFPSVKSISGHNLRNPVENLEGEGRFYITFLRDPVVRTVSHYQDQRLRGNCKLDFEEWFREESFHDLQVKHIAGEADLAKAKELLKNSYALVGMTEQFGLSLDLLRLITPYPLNTDYKRHVVASDNSIKNSILEDPLKLELIREGNRLDLELYSYVKEEIWKPLLAKRGPELDRLSPVNTSTQNRSTGSYRLNRFQNKTLYKICLTLTGAR